VRLPDELPCVFTVVGFVSSVPPCMTTKKTVSGSPDCFVQLTVTFCPGVRVVEAMEIVNAREEERDERVMSGRRWLHLQRTRTSVNFDTQELKKKLTL
jgi:hypothetical protein